MMELYRKRDLVDRKVINLILYLRIIKFLEEKPILVKKKLYRKSKRKIVGDAENLLVRSWQNMILTTYMM